MIFVTQRIQKKQRCEKLSGNFSVCALISKKNCSIFHILKVIVAFTIVHCPVTVSKQTIIHFTYVQLNEYQTDPYFLQLIRNMATMLYFPRVFFPVFTCFAPIFFRTIFGTKQVHSDKGPFVNYVSTFLTN